MAKKQNHFQITRKDARNCFVESLWDAFEIGKIHFVFATYDLTRPEGNRQTNNVSIYITVDEFLELCRKLCCGELYDMMQSKKKINDKKPLYECIGGTSAEELKKYGRSRPDGKSLSRTAKIVVGDKTDILFVADSGPGDEAESGLIVPRFGNKSENHVAVSMTFTSLSELLLMTQTHYQAWLTSWYLRKFGKAQKEKPVQVIVQQENGFGDMFPPMF